MSGTAQSVVRMANQIARNFAALGDEAATQQTAEHISLFWDPRMKAAAFALDPDQFSPIARAAIDRLKAGIEGADAPVD